MFNKKEYMKQYRIDNKEKLKEYDKKRGKQYYIDNYEETSKRHRQYYIENSERIKEKSKQYQLINKEHRKEYRKQYYQEHKERSLELGRQWNIKNKEERKIYRIENRKRRKKYESMMRRENSKYNLTHKISRGIKYSLKESKNGRHWEDLVGYTSEALIKHLKQTIPEGYTWQDYMEGRLHIDHKIPISAHNFTKPEHPDFKRCWSLDNLQLLPARENLTKSNKLARPFQPALKI